MSKRLAGLISVTVVMGAVGVGGAQARGWVPTHARVAALQSALAARGAQTGPHATTSDSLAATFSAQGGAPALGALPRAIVGSTPQGSTFDPATRTVYAANAGGEGTAGSVNTLSVIDARTCNATDTTGCTHTAPTVAAGDGADAVAIDDATHTVYVADGLSNTVSVINGATCNAQDTSGCGQQPTEATVGQGPAAIAFDPATDTVYVSNSGPGVDGTGHTVSVINAALCNATHPSGCQQKPATINVGLFPFGLAVDQANHTLYVNQAPENEVAMVDIAHCHGGDTSGCKQTPPTAPAGQFPVPVVLDTHTNTVYVGDDNAPTVSVLNADTCNATDTSGCRAHPITLNVLGGPDGLAINETTDTLFVANNGLGPGTLRTDSVSVVDATTCNANTTTGCHRPSPTAIVGANPGGNTVDPATNTLYVTTFDNTEQVVNGATCNSKVITGCGQAAPATLAGPDPFSSAVNPATNTVYVGDGGGFEGFPWTISALDAAHCSTLDSSGCAATPATIPMQFLPFGLAVDTATDTLYASNNFNFASGTGDTVSVINGATCNGSDTSGCGAPPASVTVGEGPAGVAVNQATNTIYVANAKSISVIDGKTCNATNTTGCSRSQPRVWLRGLSPLNIAVDQITDTIYVLSPGDPGVVSVINGATCNSTVTTGCGKNPPRVTVGNDDSLESLAVNPVTDTIYVVNSADDTLSVIDGATCNAGDTSGCGQTPPVANIGRQGFGYVTVDPAADRVFVTNFLDDDVSVINGATCNATNTSGCGQVAPTVPVGPNPAGIVFDRANGNVYADDNALGPVSFFAFQRPGAPTGVTASVFGGQADVVWKAPAHGGLPVTYRVFPTPGCAACTGLTTPATSGAPFTTISGLTPGQTYTFRVQASDAAGTGQVSGPSNAIRR